jgi:hypothetical protein
MRLIPAVLALALILCVPCFANDFPDTPQPKSEVIHIVEKSPHKFYNREAKITLVTEGLLLTGDSIITCRNLAPGGTEDWLPTHKCGSTVALMVGFHAAAEGAAYLLHRTRLHKLERFPRLYLAAGNAQGMAFSIKNNFK